VADLVEFALVVSEVPVQLQAPGAAADTLAVLAVAAVFFLALQTNPQLETIIGVGRHVAGLAHTKANEAVEIVFNADVGTAVFI